MLLLQTSKIIAAGGDFNTPYSADGQQAAVAAAVAKGVGKSNVIRAVIDKLWYPITVEVLYKVSVTYRCTFNESIYQLQDYNMAIVLISELGFLFCFFDRYFPVWELF